MSYAEFYLNASKYITNTLERSLIASSYQMAVRLHRNQYRDSGDAYINHPLAVASILVEMHASANVICAGLLHDVLEDTRVTVDDISYLLNKDIALLVAAVTKASRDNFTNKEDYTNAYNSKIVKGIGCDLRIIEIKLADRLHNMRTLGYKKEKTRKEEIALETMNIYVPIAKQLGAYHIKYELEELCFKTLSPSIYNALKRERENIYELVAPLIESEISNIIKTIGHDKKFFIEPIMKNTYGIYKAGFKELVGNNKRLFTKSMLNDYKQFKRITSVSFLKSVPELIQVKIIAETINDCYDIATVLKQNNRSLIKDRSEFNYIKTPKKNRYRSIDFIIENNIPVQIQIRTKELDLQNSYGFMYQTDQIAYKKSNFSKKIEQLIKTSSTDKEILEQFKRLATDKIKVYTYDGDVLLLDPESTVTDFAYKIHSKVALNMTGAKVNGKYVRYNEPLKNGDVVEIKTNRPRLKATKKYIKKE